MTLAHPDPAPLLSAFLGSNAETTRRGYAGDLELFRGFLEVPTVADAARELLADAGRANLLALRWKNAMLSEGRKSATINRRLAALRSLVSLANRLGFVPWQLQVDSLPKDEPNVQGPSWASYLAIVDAEPSARTKALLRLLGDRGLRIAEVLSLDLEHVSPDFLRVQVLGKGKRDRKWLDLSPVTATALFAWVTERGREPGPLFGLSYQRAYALVRAAGERCGVRLRPHGLRHAAITRALDVSKGDVRKVRAYSRHARVDTVLVYDDARENVAGEIARAVTEG